ncbi:MAG: glycosyltransferase family 2 protein [Labedaea sp.]
MYTHPANIATFVMPYYGDGTASCRYLQESIDSIHAQTDQEWRLVIVDDGSPRNPERIRELPYRHHNRVFLLQQAENRGQGFCRNIGVRWAAEHGSGFVLFQDADDLAHPRRLELSRKLLAKHPEVDFVYSTFSVVDEIGQPVPEEQLTPSIREILDSHRRSPVSGPNAWIRIGTDTGYTTLTSTVAVRTHLALEQPFPHVRSSEDSHTWLRMSAAGGSFAYLPAIPSRYRIPQDVAGSSDRSRIGPDYYRKKAEVDTDGFVIAIAIALDRATIAPSDVPDLKAAFLRRLAHTMRREGQHGLAREILSPQYEPAMQNGQPIAATLRRE